MSASGGPIDTLFADFQRDLPDWYVYAACQRPPNKLEPAPWTVGLQHVQGALYTSGRGNTFAEAFACAQAGARAIEAGRANCRAAPAPRAAQLDPDFATL